MMTLLAFAAAAAEPARAECGPDVLGTSRILTLEREPAAYGVPQHAALPLAAGEVVITFDDGPVPETTPKVLAALREQCVRATFFMVGEPLARNPALARQVLAQGHSIGLHGNTHAHAPPQTAAEQLADLQAAQEAYRRAFGAVAPAWRFPFLEETPTLLDALKAQAVTVMSVDVGIDDWLPDQSPRMLADRLVERLSHTGGGIILMHDAQVQTAAALPLLLATLKAHGYRVVHLEWAPAPPTRTSGAR
jgi:peptidoglycan-N-acetylglucosamine deacetylase